MSAVRERTGTIVGVSGPLMSGLRTLHFRDGTTVLVESGFGMRQLYGAARAMGRKTIVGMRIRYRLDDMGLGVMAAFRPVGGR